MLGTAFVCGVSILITLANWQLQFADNTAIHFAHSVALYLKEMSWGLAAAIFFVGLLSRVPQQAVMKVIGTPGSINGLLRATAAGLVFDLCNHGILVVAMKFYQKGASLGQTMAFLIASPWNSFSLTFIMITLIGWKFTVVFIFFSMVIAFLSGIVFDICEKNGWLPDFRPREPGAGSETGAESQTAEESAFSWRLVWRQIDLRFATLPAMLLDGVKDSVMIIRWLFLGVILASFIQTFVSAEILQTYFGPTLVGTFFTLIATTVIEVCSEGSTPIAAEIMHRAKSPGNAFVFLMGGVSTDYTEIMAIKDTTKSWRIAFFLPLITLPQIILVAVLLNHFA